MKAKQLGIRLTEVELDNIRKRAEARGMTASEYLRDLAAPPVDKLLSLTTGGRYSESVIRLVLQAAEEVADRPERAASTAAVEWLSDCSQHLGWLADNPWHPESCDRTMHLLKSLPEGVKVAIKQGVGDIL